MRRLMVWVVAVSVALALSGCQKKEEAKKPAEPSQAKPEPTPEEIAMELRAAFQPVAAFVDTGGAIPQELKDQALSQLRTGKAKHQGTANGKKALAKIGDECEDKIKQASEAKLWYKVLLYCEALETLEPSNTVFVRYRDRATKEINKPRVTVKGIITDETTGSTNVSLQIYDPPTGKTETIWMREGEEHKKLRLIRIIGVNRGVEMEYLETGDKFEVPWRK
ncbi:MAG: hypothetical protein HY706_04635 [Candidatus Hydrogenedentes bacterium]|nr:hypothetical protein [Candidatus Hydrogenedentota bacterium]